MRAQLALTIGSQTRHAHYSSQYRDGSLKFSYRVQSVDRDTDGLSIAANALTLGGRGPFVHLHSRNTRVNLNLGRHAISNDARCKVSGARVSSPRVLTVSFITSIWPGPDFQYAQVYGLGCVYDLLVEFDKEVDVTGQPQLALTIGTQTRQAWYAYANKTTGLHSATLHFAYAVHASDRDIDGVSLAGASALTLKGDVIKGGKIAVNLDLSRSIRIRGESVYHGVPVEKR